MKSRIHTLVLALLALGTQATAQENYIVDQRLDGRISALQVDRGWHVRVERDTMNLISIETPCGYFFTEGNEPNICKLQSNGRLCIWRNESMPQGTRVVLHLRDTLGSLQLLRGAILDADTLLMGPCNAYPDLGLIHAYSHSTLTVGSVLGSHSLSLKADSSATVRIGTVRCPGRLRTYSQHGTTLLVDTLDCGEVRNHRNPKATDNLPATDTARHIKTTTVNRWFSDGVWLADGGWDLVWNSPFNGMRYNSPLSTALDLEVQIYIHTNPVQFAPHWALTVGVSEITKVQVLNNASQPQGSGLQLVNGATNSIFTASAIGIGLPLRISYMPKDNDYFRYVLNLHAGLEPRVYFGQTFGGQYVDANNHTHSRNTRMRMLNPVQVRAEVGLKLMGWVDMSLYADLLPSYRKGFGADGVHTVGLQLRF